MEELHHPKRERFKHGILVLLDAAGWISLGLTLGFFTMWGGMEFAFYIHAPYNYIFEGNRTLIFVFLIIICIVAVVLRIHQRRRNATVGDYWRVLISLVLYMGVGSIGFHMVNGLISLV